MPKKIKITVKNKLQTQKRTLSLYCHLEKSSHLISDNSTWTVTLKPVEQEDYIHISVIQGPGNLKKECRITLPSWLDFQLTSRDDFTQIHSGDRTILKIPPGPPIWALKITQPADSSIKASTGNTITVEDIPEC